ncbi:homeodomain-interacting protein kinase 2-like [Micropterus dolomieu]|uniref:homeodomain-interacting protein kinase 2-like n=1 Tax=Micropterus dolomieu TaxID=147949 RepID=UPI001E8EE59F|nr:homeodomain-interacting protein kinase 2-like [Micropterus dolomieu]
MLSLESYTENEDIPAYENHILSDIYLVQNLKGQGTFGKVAHCIKLDTMENVAVKIVKKHFTWAGEREAFALKKLRVLDLNKSNLVKFFESFEHRGQMCLVLEMLDKSLHDLMIERRNRPLRLSEIRVISQQMLVALNALKNIGLVHADIKPDNVMLVHHQLQPFRVKLIDFGMASPVSIVKHGSIIQALGYRAPEVILGLPVDEAIDMWSLGCVMAFMYLGQHLYPIRCEYEVVRIIVQMQGQPGDHLLDAGVHSKKFFSKNQDSTKQVWRLNTPAEYKLETGQETQQSRAISNKYTCMEDMTKDHPKPKADTEYEDTRAFLSFLKRTLSVDSVTRIAPTEALGHRFITMRHFPRDTDPDPYVASSCVNMKVCPSQDSPVEISCFVTSSEVLHHSATTASSDASPPATTCCDVKTNAGTNGSDGGTTFFITVKTQKAMLKRMLSVCCCFVDVED